MSCNQFLEPLDDIDVCSYKESLLAGSISQMQRELSTGNLVVELHINTYSRVNVGRSAIR